MAEKVSAAGWNDRQKAINLISDGWWADYAEHRDVVTNLVVEELTVRSPDSRRLSILGAGNGNDLQLGMVAELAEHLTLIDIDPDALARAVTRHELSPRSNVTTETCDLLRVTDPVPKDDLVVSAGLLTQLLDNAASTFESTANDGSQLAHRMLEVRDRHLRLMNALAIDTGRRLLVTDVVSSLTCPALLSNWQERGAPALRELLLECLETGNFFTGSNPFAIEDRLRAMGYDSVVLQGPWLWRMADTARLACAISW